MELQLFEYLRGLDFLTCSAISRWVANQTSFLSSMCSMSFSSMRMRLRCPIISGCIVKTKKYPPLLIPFLLLFFGAILLMGLPMYKMNRRLWFVTVATTLFLLASMGAAMRRGVG